MRMRLFPFDFAATKSDILLRGWRDMVEHWSNEAAAAIQTRDNVRISEINEMSEL